MLSLFIYGSVFYFYQQTTIIKPQQMNSGEQSIQLKLITAEAAEEPVAEEEVVTHSEPVKDKESIKEEQTAELKEPVTKDKMVTDTEPEKAETKIIETAETATVINSIANHSEIKIAQENSAREDAMLKGELFDEPFNLNLPAPPGSYKATRYADDKIIASTAAVNSTGKKQSKKLLKPTVTENKEKTNTKTKRVFKKENSSAKEQGVLQEAIVVSGNKPTYPQRAILRNQHGRVVVKLTVTMQGKTKNPQITRSSGFPILDNAVLDFVKNELFMPAHKGVEKITTEQLFSFRFELK